MRGVSQKQIQKVKRACQAFRISEHTKAATLKSACLETEAISQTSSATAFAGRNIPHLKPPQCKPQTASDEDWIDLGKSGNDKVDSKGSIKGIGSDEAMGA